MDKKKLSFSLKIAALIFAALTLLMFAEVGLSAAGSGFTCFEYIFNRGLVSADKLYYNAIYIVGFALILISIISVATLVVMKIFGKGNAQLNKWLLIAALVGLVYVIIATCLVRVAYAGEMVKGWEYTWAEAWEEAKTYAFGVGALGQIIFGALGVGSLATAYVLDK